MNISNETVLLLQLTSISFSSQFHLPMSHGNILDVPIPFDYNKTSDTFQRFSEIDYDLNFISHVP